MADNTAGEHIANIPVAVSLVCMLLPGVAVAVRFWSRSVADRRGFGWDDWTCLAAQVLNIGYCCIGLVWSRHGSGQRADSVSPNDLNLGLKLLFASYYIQPAELGFIKLSALFFYGRVFPKQNKRFTHALYFGHALIAVWMVFSVFATTFNCDPIRKFWEPDIKGRCLSSYACFLIMSSVDTLQDIYILVLPLPMLWRLKTTVSKRVLVGVAMLLGYCCGLSSLGRLIYVMKSANILKVNHTWAATEVLLWSFFEPAIGIISICVPSYFHLFRKAKKDGVASLFTRKNQHRVLQQYTDDSRERSKMRLTSFENSSGVTKSCYVHKLEDVRSDSCEELQRDVNRV